MYEKNESQVESTNADGLKKLAKMIEGISLAMLTTVDDRGILRSRPMATQQAEFDGTLWFFTKESSGKSDEVKMDSHVNVAYSDNHRHSYVSASGDARIVRDGAKMKELWNPFVAAWFPKGLEDPELCLLKVNVSEAEYWDAPASRMVQLIKMATGALTGKPPQMGNHEKLQIKA